MIEKKLKKVMSSILGVSIDDINENSSPDNIETWDSLQHMNLVLGIEQSFGIEFTEEEIVTLLSYELILETIKGKL